MVGIPIMYYESDWLFAFKLRRVSFLICTFLIGGGTSGFDMYTEPPLLRI